MYNSEYKVRSREITPHVPTSPPPSKLKTFGFAVAIIVGIGGLAVGAAGLAGYFHVGALSNMAQIHAIIMMAVGGGGGVILLIVGIVGTVKNRQPVSHQSRSNVNPRHESAPQETGSTQKTGNISSVDTQGELVYGPGAWPALGTKWGCELKILDVNIPDAPKEDVAEGRVRIYIPQTVSVNGEKKDFTLNTLIEINTLIASNTSIKMGSVLFEYSDESVEMGNVLFEYFDGSVKEKFGNTTASGWIEIDRSVIEESRSKNYNTQKRMVEQEGCRMPRVLEAVVLNLMVFAFTAERLYGDNPLIYTRCSEKVNDTDPVNVGGFSAEGLGVGFDNFVSDQYGVAAVREF